MIKCSLVILGCREDEHCRCPHDLFSSSSGGGASGPSRGVPFSYGWRSLQLQLPPWEASDPSGRPEPDTVGWLRTACAGRGRGRDRRAETAGEGRCHGDRQDVPVLRQRPPRRTYRRPPPLGKAGTAQQLMGWRRPGHQRSLTVDAAGARRTRGTGAASPASCATTASHRLGLGIR